MKKQIILSTILALTLTITSCIFKGLDDLSKAKAYFEISATELFDAYDTDEDAANKNISIK